MNEELWSRLFREPYAPKRDGRYGDGYVAIVYRQIGGADVILECIGEVHGGGWLDRFTPAMDLGACEYVVRIEGVPFRLVGAIDLIPPDFRLESGPRPALVRRMRMVEAFLAKQSEAAS